MAKASKSGEIDIALLLLLWLERRHEHSLVHRDAELGTQRGHKLQNEVVGDHAVELLAEAFERFLFLCQVGRLDRLQAQDDTAFGGPYRCHLARSQLEQR